MEPKGQDGIQAYASILHGLKEAMERLLACYCLKYYGREVASINEISMGGGGQRTMIAKRCSEKAARAGAGFSYRSDVRMQMQDSHGRGRRTITLGNLPLGSGPGWQIAGPPVRGRESIRCGCGLPSRRRTHACG